MMNAWSSDQNEHNKASIDAIDELTDMITILDQKIGLIRDSAERHYITRSAASRKVKENIQKTRSLLEQFDKGLPLSDVLHVSDPGSLSPEIALKRDKNQMPKNLLDPIGGSAQLQEIVSRVYVRLAADTRLRAFFEKSVAKMRCLQERLCQFLEGYLKSRVKRFDLKTAHYHLNITDYHVDAFLEAFAEVMKAMGNCPEIVTECVSRMGEIRADITTGYTIRCELARINTNPSTCETSLCDRIGGLEGIIGFVDIFYDIIANDPRISSYFVGHSFEKIKHGQRAYITELIGGPKLYRGRTLEEIHVNLAIDDYLFDCYVQDAALALKQCGVSYELTDQVLMQLESVRAAVVGQHRGVDDVIHRDTAPGKDSNIFNSNYSNRTYNSASSTGSASPLSESLFMKLGGTDMLKTVVSSTFEICAKDKRMRIFFDPTNVSRRSKFEIGFFNCVLTVSGGPVMYDLTQLRATHYDLDITDIQFDAFMSNLKKACHPFMNPEVTNRLVGRLSKLRSEITAGFTIRSHLGGCPFK